MQKNPKRSTWDTVKSLTGYLWPQDRIDLKTRVVVSMACLFIAKAINVYVPFL